jgi:DNA-binding transcriptional regulator GbsR (MarR family)
LISISFCTLSSVTFTIKNVQKEIDINSEVFGIVNSEIVKVTDENVQKEIDINTEVLWIVNSEIAKVTDENVQKEIDINTSVHSHLLLLLFHY